MFDLRKDPICHNLAMHLAKELNSRYQKDSLEYNTKLAATNLDRTIDSVELYNPNLKVIKSIRTYDAIEVPLDQFPLLKVYRESDITIPRTTFRTSNITITYNLTFQSLETLSGLLQYASQCFIDALMSYQLTHKSMLPIDNQGGIFVDYGLQNNELIQATYPFLAIRGIQIKDTCSPPSNSQFPLS